MEHLVEMTKVSSKGQVVLPRAIRHKLHIQKGEQLIVVCGDDSVLLKKIETPLKERFTEMMKTSQTWAKKVGLTRTDIQKAIREVRQRSK